MNKKEILIGIVVGILSSILGCYLFIITFTNFDFIAGIEAMRSEGKLGKLITVGSILDLVVFAVLLHFNKEAIARGVVLAVFILAFFTLIV